MLYSFCNEGIKMQMRYYLIVCRSRIQSKISDPNVCCVRRNLFPVLSKIYKCSCFSNVSLSKLQIQHIAFSEFMFWRCVRRGSLEKKSKELYCSLHIHSVLVKNIFDIHTIFK